MAFALQTQSVDWIERAPIHIENTFDLCASTTQVFGVLIDHERWPTWFQSMRKVRIDGQASGVGALRTVWVGLANVQEEFVRWDENQRLTFNIVQSSLPGMTAMTEDWQIVEAPNGHTTLRIAIYVSPDRFTKYVPSILRAAVANSTKGAAGITKLFPCSDEP